MLVMMVDGDDGDDDRDNNGIDDGMVVGGDYDDGGDYGD